MSELVSEGALLNMDTTPEVKKEAVYHYVGRLGELGIGNPDGIPSKLKDATEQELNEYGEKLVAHVADVTDKAHLGCIDGRNCQCNADGSDPEVRMGRVGGTAANVEVAFNADAPVIADISPDAEIGEIVGTVDGVVEEKAGIKRSAHLGGCGGANGAIEDNENIAANDKLADVVGALFSHPAIKPHIDATIDISEDWKPVKQRAAQTAGLLKQAGWVGQEYVDGVKSDEPQGVEDLETADDPYHGHAEDALAIVVGERTIEMPNVFVWNIEASKEAAAALAGGDPEAYKRLLIAEFAKHVAVADRLPSSDTPVYVIET